MAEYNKEAYKTQLKSQEEILKAQLDIQRNYAEQLAQMIREIAVARTKGNIEQATQIAVKQYEKDGWKVTPIGDGNGTLVFTPPPSSGLTPFIFNTSQVLGDKTDSPVPLSPYISISQYIPAQQMR